MTRLELVGPDAPGDDRIQRRRRATLAEILEVSLQVMSEEGVGGLSLSEVARRMGIKQPSLYKHVDSKMAVYDLLFAAGARAHDAAIDEAVAGRELDVETLATGFEAGVRWCIDNPTLTQLLYWRPVPGFEPSPLAFAPSLASMERLREVLGQCVDRGELRAEAASEGGVAMFTCLFSGVITQQLANQPGVPFEQGRFTRHTGEAFACFLARYGARAPQ
ncbi:MAG TPA: TetR/AcrR family transcriptional regulator [Egibacteraceae bacterium]|nr:TetR/AcrR family transcriptional regulator [Egibacteraceae bacterium]